MALELVEMTHPRLPGQVARVPRQAVPHHQRSGWRPADPPEPSPTENRIKEAPASAEASALPDDQPTRRRRTTRGDE